MVMTFESLWVGVLEVSGLDDVEKQKLVGWRGGSLSELKAELFILGIPRYRCLTHGRVK
jgi:hypothetical protein